MAISRAEAEKKGKREQVYLPFVLPPSTTEVNVIGASGIDLTCYAPKGGHLVVENLCGAFLTHHDSTHIYVNLGHHGPSSPLETCEVGLLYADHVIAKGPYGERVFGKL